MMTRRKEILWPQNLGIACFVACLCIAVYAVFGNQLWALITLVPLTVALCKFVQLDVRMNRDFMAEKYPQTSGTSH
jgi:hypothetical protein